MGRCCSKTFAAAAPLVLYQVELKACQDSWLGATIAVPQHCLAEPLLQCSSQHLYTDLPLCPHLTMRPGLSHTRENMNFVLPVQAVLRVRSIIASWHLEV
jgi:hypothetical protein